MPMAQVSAIVQMIEAMLDPVSRAIANAPIDDEPESEAEPSGRRCLQSMAGKTSGTGRLVGRPQHRSRHLQSPGKHRASALGSSLPFSGFLPKPCQEVCVIFYASRKY
jgi:hypothetical protein